MRDFFGCYLLHSKHPATKDRTYIGFTVNPRRRIKQHNGIISAGAWKTCKHRPWEMQLVVYGFATQTQALQFEWAWQHPDKSKAARPVAKQLGKSKMAGVKGKISLMLGMLAVSPWCYYPLTIQYLSTVSYQIAARLGPPPPTIRVVVAPLEDLPASVSDDEDEDARQAGGARSRKGSKATNKHAAKEELGAAPKATCSGGAGIAAASQALKSADEEDEEEDGGSELGSGSDGEGPSQMAGSDCEEELSCAEEEVNVLPPDGKSWKCDLCESVIDRFVMRCTSAGGGCGRAFHLSCIAADWAMQVAEDPHAAPSLSGIRAGSQGGAGASRPRAVPERGLCPACQHQHSWLELLGSMLPYGYAVKQRKRKFKNRRRVLADPSLKPASSRGTKGTAAGAAGAQGDDTGTSQPAPKKPRAGAKKAAGATGAAAGAGSEVAASAAVTDVVPTNSQVAAPAGTKPKRPPRPKNAKPDASHAPQPDGIALQGKPPPQHACEGAVSEAAGHSQGPTQGTVISGQGSPEVLSLAQRLQRRMQQGPAPAAAPAASAVAASQLQGAVTASHGGVTSATSQGRRVMMPADEQKERQSSQLNGVGGEADDDDDVSSPLGYLRQLQRTRKPVAGPALAIQDQQAGQGLTPASSKHKSPTLHPIHSHSQGHQMLQRGVSHASPPAHTAAAVTAAARPVPEIDLTCSPSPVPLARRLAGRHAGPADQHETALPAASQARSALASGQAGGCSVRGAAGGGEDERSLSCSGLSDVPQQEEDEEQDQLQHPTPKSTMRHARMPVVCISDSEEEGEPDGDGQRVQVGTVQVGMVQMAAVQVGAVQERAVQEPVGSSQLLQSQYGHVALACGKQGSGTQAGAVAVENCSAQQPHVKPLAGAAPSGCHDAAKENREVIEILD